jgi:hypothetical protein
MVMTAASIISRRRSRGRLELGDGPGVLRALALSSFCCRTWQEKASEGSPERGEKVGRGKEACSSPTRANLSGDARSTAGVRRAICAAWRRVSERKERGEVRGLGFYRGGLRAGGGRASEARSINGWGRLRAGGGDRQEEGDDAWARAVSG